MTKKLTAAEADAFLMVLKNRFEKNMNRHPGVSWAVVLEKLKAQPEKLASLHAMEVTGGEPDVLRRNEGGALVFMDCTAESPAGRRRTCYDSAAWEARKEHKPKTSALEMAAIMGTEILTESDYRFLQTVGNFDTKTSSWIATPADIRNLGGALFCDRRYNTVFVYHNGAESYYAARGFRAFISL